MDKISIFGLALGVATIVVGQVLEGGHVASLVQPTALLIVFGGTLGAVMLQSPLPVFLAGMRMGAWVFYPPVVEPQKLIGDLGRWSQIARKEGLLALEGQINTLSDPFVRKGLEPDRLREVLEVEISAYEAKLKLASKVWESAGGYSPTIGILGAVMGLIHVMENLTDPAKLGSGIAVAFVATIYGVGAANLIFLPVAKKLMANIARLITLREMLVDGLVGIANGDNPRIVESRLRGYFS
jgi:chemotaxis protein MotA